MRRSELIKLLKKNNCYIIRQGHRHTLWFSPITQKKFAVPRHAKEIPNGTLHNIMNDSGLK